MFVRWNELSVDGQDEERQLPGYRDPAVVRTFDAPEALDVRFYEVRAKSALNRVPKASRMPFRWTINPYRGCTHACAYCGHGDTPILMHDGRTRPLADIRSGDRVYGTVRQGAYRRYAVTEVRDHWSTIKPAFRVTNEAIFGYAFDKDTSPEGLELIRVEAGSLATSGDPRGWNDNGLTSIKRFARAYAANGPNATEWYYPRRLLLDVDAASALRQTPAARYLGLRLTHTKEIADPLYAYGTALTDGAVERGARRVVRGSRIRRSRIVGDPGANHLDPLLARPARNRFLRTVVPFLRRGLR